MENMLNRTRASTESDSVLGTNEGGAFFFKTILLWKVIHSD